MTRHCACGCEKELKGSSTQRFASDACRKRVARAAARRNGSADGVADNPDAGHRPQITPGRVRSGLESWLEDHDDLPAPLVAAARALSDEVDRRPSASPLWGSLTTILTELVTPQVQAQALTEDLRRLYEYLLIGPGGRGMAPREAHAGHRARRPLSGRLAASRPDRLRSWPPFVEAPSRLLGRRALPTLRHRAEAVSAAVPDPERPRPRPYPWQSERDRLADEASIGTPGGGGADYECVN